MKNIFSLFFVVSLMLYHSSSAQWIDMQGNPIPDTSYRKAIGIFGAHLVLTDKEWETFKKWDTSSKVVDIDTTNKIKKNKFITALIIFSGCGVDKNGNCNLIVKFKVLQPDGSVYADILPQEAWVGKPAPPERTLGMSIGYIRVRIEPHEPSGMYTVLADVIDKNSNLTLKLSNSFEAIE